MKNIQFFQLTFLFFISLSCSSILAEAVTSGNSAEMNASAPQPQSGGSSAIPTGSSSTSQGTSSAASPTVGSPSSQNAGPTASSSGAASQSSSSTATPAGGSSPTSQSAASKASPSNGSSVANSGKGSEKQQKPASKDTGGDSSLVANIQANIATHSDLATTNVVADSKNGRVNLIGNVTSEDKASQIIKIATSIKGVKEVDTTKLTVNNEKINPDSVITAKIKGLFIRDKLFGSESIVKPLNVQTKNGVVTLTGTVTNQKHVNNAIKLAKAVSGVSKVKSEIVVIENNK